MNTCKLSRILPALVLGLCAGAVAAQQPAPGTKPAAPPAPAAPAKTTPVAPARVSPGAPARGSELVGQKVVDASDKKLGKVEDIVVQDSGEVTAVVERESGGLICVPMSALQPKLKKQDADKEGTPTAEVEDFLYTADAAQLAAAATIANVEALDAAALERCREYFAGKSASKTEPAAKPQEGKGTDKPAAMTSVTKPWCVKKLVGTNLKDSAGEGLGDVKDVAIDLGRGQVAYVVISTGGVMGVGDKLHGVPLGRLIRTADGKDLALPVTKDSLKALKGFDIDHLPMTPDISVSATGDLVTPSSTDSNS